MRVFSSAFLSEPALRRFFLKKGVFAGLAVLTASLTAAAYHLTTKEFPPGSILRVSLGIADFPFQSRILVYGIAQFLSKTLSLNLYAVHFLLRCLAIVGILYTLRGLLKHLGFQSPWLPLLFPWATLFSFAGEYSYPTDFPEILAFALMLLLILKKRWLWLIVVFVLAFLNRESAVLILPFLGLQALRQEKKIPGLVCLLAMILLAVGLRALVLPHPAHLLSLADHPQKLFLNLEVLKKIPFFFSSQQGRAVRFLIWRLLSFSGFLYLAVILNKNRTPLALRRFLLTTAPFVLLAAALVGNLDETRTFYPLLPGLILGAAIYFDGHPQVRKLIMSLLLLAVAGFFAKTALSLPRSGEFLTKAAAFRVRDFNIWKRIVWKFSAQEMTVQGDRVFISLANLEKKCYFMDAMIVIRCSPQDPIPLLCRYYLKDGLSHVEYFQEGAGVLSALGRHIEFEMQYPSVQTMTLEKIMVRFTQDLAGKALPDVTLRAFSIAADVTKPGVFAPGQSSPGKGI